MLTTRDRRKFEDSGLLALRQAVELPETRLVLDEVWSFLAAHRDVDRHRPQSWTTDRPTGLQPLTRSGVLDRVWTPTVRDAVESLLGPEQQQSRERMRLLVTLPQAGVWTVPVGGWHFDYTPVTGAADPRAVQVFVLLDDVRPRGGGTLVLSGSHRLVSDVVRAGRDPRPGRLRAELAARSRWLTALWQPGPPSGEDRAARFLGQTELVDGVPLEVIELTGRAGDVFVMHSDCFHAMSTNALDAARVMCTSLVARHRTG